MNMQQQPPQTMNSAPSTPLSLVSTEQIQKYLDENKNLILAILENQNLGKLAECAQYQAVLQKNLMYLAAIADAQPPGSSPPSQPTVDSTTPLGNSQTPQNQAPIMQQQAGVNMAKLPFQPNAPMTPEQKNQMFQFQQQQQLQAHFRGPTNNNMHLLMQPGLSNSGSGQGNSGMGPMDGRER